MVPGAMGAYVVSRGAMISHLRNSVAYADSPEETQKAALTVYYNLTILGGAMAEGIGTFSTGLVLVNGQAWLLVFPAAAILILLSQIPSESRIRSWIAEGLGPQAMS